MQPGPHQHAFAPAPNPRARRRVPLSRRLDFSTKMAVVLEPCRLAALSFRPMQHHRGVAAARSRDGDTQPTAGAVVIDGLGPRSARLPALAVTAVLALAGCSATVTDGRPVGGEPAHRATDLSSLLLSPEEADAAMHTSGMTIDTTMSTMVDDSGNVEPAACLPVASIAQDGVYAGSGWDAVRVQSLHEPGEDFEHLLHQAVVEFPAPRDAAAFYAESIDTWAACTDTYTYTPTGVIWSVGESAQDGAVLTVATSQQDATWLCSRALSAAVAVVVDVLTCSGDDRSAMTAGTVAQQIAARATNQ